MPYYRVSRNKYNIGDLIFESEIGIDTKKGIESILSNDKLHKFTDDNNYFTAIREAVFESIRENVFNQKPSRYNNSMMVFDSLENAVTFKTKYRFGIESYIYEVIPEILPIFFGDMEWTDAKFKSLEELEEISKKYWNSDMTENPIKEFITTLENKFIIVKKH